MSHLKPDAAAFVEHIRRVQADFQDDARAEWTKYLFHFTDIRNAVGILQDNILLARSVLTQRGVRFIDAANPDIIQKTSPKRKELVRLYFRPLTPTLFHNEGIRPQSRSKNSHCPVPVYFLFDLVAVIQQSQTQFSRGNIASGQNRLLSTAEEFANMPFKLIYHTGGFSPDERDIIVNHRQAEVVVPQSLGLEHLREICCRSEAERDTLKHLLSKELWEKWKGRVRTAREMKLFHRKWLYVEGANLTNREVIFEFNKPENFKDVGPFDVKIEFITSTGKRAVWEQKKFYFREFQLSLELSSLADMSEYEVTMTIDGCVAYKNYCVDFSTEIPF
jgi:hypothetical protein